MADIVYPGKKPKGTLGATFLPTNEDIYIYRGDDFEFQVFFTDDANAPINLTGYTGKLSLRTAYDTPASVEATVTLANAPGGVVDVLFSSTLTKTLTAGSYAYDLQLTSPTGRVRTYLTGDVTIYEDIST